MQLVIQSVAVEAVYALRNKVLRPNQPIKDCHYPEDNDASAFHLAAIYEEKIIGIASFYRESHQDLPSTNSFRLRGMAVEPEYQSYGIGSGLLTQAIDICHKADADLLWCNARVLASSFYQKLGFKAAGNAFQIEAIGEHYLMYRLLK